MIIIIIAVIVGIIMAVVEYRTDKKWKQVFRLGLFSSVYPWVILVVLVICIVPLLYIESSSGTCPLYELEKDVYYYEYADSSTEKIMVHQGKEDGSSYMAVYSANMVTFVSGEKAEIEVVKYEVVYSETAKKWLGMYLPYALSFQPTVKGVVITLPAGM